MPARASLQTRSQPRVSKNGKRIVQHRLNVQVQDEESVPASVQGDEVPSNASAHERQQQEIEAPIPVDEMELAFDRTQRAGSKRNSSTSFEDHQSKRLKNQHNAQWKKARHPHSYYPAPMEQPKKAREANYSDSRAHLAFGVPVGAKRIPECLETSIRKRHSQSTKQSFGKTTASLGEFQRLPTEIRAHILRFLLIHPSEIPVFRCWSSVFPRTRPKLSLAILRTCKVLKDQGTNILYGDNVFVYQTRDPSESHANTSEVMRRVFHEDGCQVPIQLYGHLFKKIKILIDNNRSHKLDTRQAVAESLEKFLPDNGLQLPARLNTITIELQIWLRPGDEHPRVPIVRYFERGGRIIQALKLLDIQYIRILAGDNYKNWFELLIDKRSQLSQRHAQNGGLDVWETDKLMIESRAREARKVTARVENLGRAIEELAIAPDWPTPKFKMWKPVKHRKGYQEPPQSLGTNYTERSCSVSQNRRSRSQRQTTCHSQRHVNQEYPSSTITSSSQRNKMSPAEASQPKRVALTKGNKTRPLQRSSETTGGNASMTMAGSRQLLTEAWLENTESITFPNILPDTH